MQNDKEDCAYYARKQLLL